MRIRLLTPALVALVLTTGAAAQTASPQAAAAQPDIIYASVAQAQDLLAKAKAERKDGQPMAPPQALVRVNGLRAYVEYRAGPTPASIHADEAELVYVMEGSGSLIVGGTLNDARRLNPANMTGTGITGGETHLLVPGVFAFVPAGAAHYYATVGGEGLAVMNLHIPVQAAKP